MTLRELKKVPLYPILPFVPLFLVGCMLAMSTLTLVSVRRLRTTIKPLLTVQPAPSFQTSLPP